MKKYHILVLFFALCALTGCGKRFVPVEGKVLFDGKPAPDIIVLFESKETSKIVSESAKDKTDAQGQFTMTSVISKKKGVQPGDYAVYFGWKDPNTQVIGDSPEENVNLKQSPCPYVFPKEINEGKFVFTVTKKGAKDVVFKITKDNVEW